MGRSAEQLLRLDAVRLSYDERLAALVEAETLVARAAAVRERLLDALDDPGDGKNWVREEVACALRWPFAVAADRLARASHLVRTLPGTLALHESRAIGEDHVRTIVEATYGLDRPVIADVEAGVLPRAATQTRTAFRAAVRRAVLAADPDGADRRHAAAVVRDKTVRVHPLPDGMAGLWSVHTAVDAEAVMARLQDLTVRPAPGDARTADSRRADALVDCILGAGHGGAGGTGGAAALVHIHVPIEGPAELSGHGSIPAALCRATFARGAPGCRRCRWTRGGCPCRPTGWTIARPAATRPPPSDGT